MTESSDDEKALELIVSLLHPRLQQKLNKQIDRAELKATIRSEMKIDPSSIRVVDVQTDGDVVRPKLEIGFRFRLDRTTCPQCKAPCHGGQPDTTHRCRCHKNCA